MTHQISIAQAREHTHTQHLIEIYDISKKLVRRQPIAPLQLDTCLFEFPHCTVPPFLGTCKEEKGHIIGINAPAHRPQSTTMHDLGNLDSRVFLEPFLDAPCRLVAYTPSPSRKDCPETPRCSMHVRTHAGMHVRTDIYAPTHAVKPKHKCVGSAKVRSSCA